ncbi:helix-turn-helix transcriptional regulator [Qipengyuania sp. SS22]|uniref:helix-turn-helix domain-containing protein n=1 Tax=Qipengyuania sp. SS22 TaxID=2979461 RepID=UPI0021E5DBE7|nr:helix-turn-helix transcriptional regulator [Qipengyuania sp. SS22]UYH56187.1 helix-turn-helix transcriptional regulator [Qipengyuania sp. SS22]
MTKSNFDQGTVDWRPDWEGDDQKRFSKYRDSFRFQGASFKELRNALGLSQADAAARLATSQSNISKIEAKSDPSISTLKKLLGVDGEMKLVFTLRDGNDLEIRVD